MRSLLAAGAAVAVLAGGCWGGRDDDGQGAIAGRGGDRLARAVTARGLRAHLVALQAIADRNGGNRASGTAGYEASVRYVVAQLRKTGYDPTLDRFTLIVSRELEPPELTSIAPERVDYAQDRDFVPLRYSGSGDVDATLEAVDADSQTSGCETGDFDGFDRGSVALVRRGGCFFFVKVRNAVAAGAVAVLVFNDGQDGHEAPLEATLLRPVAVPALSLSNALGERLAARAGDGVVRLRVRTSFDAHRRPTESVLADLPGRSDEPALIVGGHLDSITTGPGINDNGSGVAALLELAKAAKHAGWKPERPVRFAFWGGEEAGLVGSTSYVRGLPDARDRIAAVVNLDMIGSPNAEALVYDADKAIEAALDDAVRKEGLEPVPVDVEGRSDHAPFAEVGIPVGGLFSGADETAANGKPHDACYHRACDRLANVDLAFATKLADALALALPRLTASHS
jgi:Zn-dependent M28 family amino/carboxypeptidase